LNTFEDYQGVPIFEIPIYAYTKEGYRKRWEQKEKRDIRLLTEKGYSFSCAETIVHRSVEYASIWQYNRLVGMLLLTVKTDNCLYCHLYCNPQAPRSFLHRTHLPFNNQWLINECIFLNFIENDADLVQAVKSKIDFLKFQYNIERYYFDCSALENSISISKIRTIIARNIEQDKPNGVHAKAREDAHGK
jgi:hypothetical protein